MHLLHHLRWRVLITTAATCTLLLALGTAWQAQRMLRPDAGYWDEQLMVFGSFVLESVPPSAIRAPSSWPAASRVDAGGDSASYKGTVFQVWRSDGVMLFASPGAPRTPIAPIGEPERRVQTVRHEGEPWRVLTQRHPSGEFEVHSAKPYRAMTAATLQWARSTAPLLAVILLGVIVGLWLAVGWSFAGVRSFQESLKRRSDLDLTPIPLGKLPEELRPILTSFNQLLGRVAAALDGEKRFISNAAHELRTPLAALRAQAQVTQRMAGDPALAHSLQRLTAIIDRTTRLAHQLLTYARFDAHGAQREPVQLDLLTLDVVHELAELGRQRAVQLLVEVQPVTVVGDAEQVAALLRNLIDNALRYSPSGGVVAVRCAAADDCAELTVADAGPGIPEEEQELVFERFYRGRSSGGSGSGLGLAIVQQVVQGHGGAIRLSNRPEPAVAGLQVLVTLPACAAGDLPQPASA